MKPIVYIGIDPGVNTGLAVWHTDIKQFTTVQSCNIIGAMDRIHVIKRNTQCEIRIRIEDARKRTFFGNNETQVQEKRMGAGSVRRNSHIWEQFCQHYGYDFEMVHPRYNKTKLNAKQFQQFTGWNHQTNQHGRDAAMLVYGI